MGWGIYVEPLRADFSSLSTLGMPTGRAHARAKLWRVIKYLDKQEEPSFRDAGLWLRWTVAENFRREFEKKYKWKIRFEKIKAWLRYL